MSGAWRCDVCGGDRERHRNIHSERSGRYIGEQVRWEIPEDDPVYGRKPGDNQPLSGYAEVTYPFDGGFVWLTAEGYEPIVPMEFVFPLEPS